MDLTIVICTHNRLDLLKKTLKHLKVADYPPGAEISVLVMANDCSDGTLKWLESKGEPFFKDSPLSISWQRVQQRGKSHALNQALGYINTSGVAFVDDDHRVDSMYLENIINSFYEHPKAELFCGKIIPDWNGSEPSWVHDRGPFRVYPLPVPCFDLGDATFTISPKGPWPGGGNLFMRRSAARKNGPYNTGLGPVGHNLSGSEDQEWIRRALKRGLTLQYVPGVVQFHYADPKRLRLPYLLKKSFERSASVVHLLRSSHEKTIPGYLIRKFFSYGLLFLYRINAPDKRRFYLMRLFSSAGEIKGHLTCRKKKR